LVVAIKYPQDPQNHDEHDKHGSGEPAREHNNIILLAFAFSFEPTQHLLNLLAMKTRQINVPESPAEMTRQNNPPWQLAGFRCDSNPQNLLARNRRRYNPRY
jgi:hypothetical protein